MAILALATDLADVRERVGKAIVAYSREDQPQPITCEDLGVAGAVTVLLKGRPNPALDSTWIRGSP